MPATPTTSIPTRITPRTAFDELGVPTTLTAALAARGITTPRPIQARTLPDALAGRDILGRAETGSGKTLAFGLPLLVRTAAASGKRTARQPHGLVLVPTRELADQVHDELLPLAGVLDLRLLAVYGGVSLHRQAQQLRRGIDVVVATPGCCSRPPSTPRSTPSSAATSPTRCGTRSRPPRPPPPGWTTSSAP